MKAMIGSLYITDKIIGNKRIYNYNPDYRLNKYQLYLDQDFLKNIIYFEPITINSIIDNDSNISVDYEKDSFDVKNNLYLKFKSDIKDEFIELVITYNTNLGILFIHCNNKVEELSQGSIDFISTIIDNLYIAIEILDLDSTEDSKEFDKKCIDEEEEILESEPEQKEFIPEPDILEPIEKDEPEHPKEYNKKCTDEDPIKVINILDPEPDQEPEEEAKKPQTPEPQISEEVVEEILEKEKEQESTTKEGDNVEEMVEVTDFMDKFVHEIKTFGTEIIKIWEGGADAILEDRFVFTPSEENKEKIFLVEDLVSKDEYTKISLNPESNALELSVLTKQEFTKLFDFRKVY